jgi:geranylgeranyl reductase family protein
VNPIYDVAIVGAGPGGATCAWYLARQGQRVLLLDKAEFPRDKLCGDAVCSRAQVHLRRMGVLEEIVASQQGHWAAVGGLVSPGGIRFIGDSAKQKGEPLVIAIKRKVLDEKVARAAAQAGACLAERSPVAGVEFSKREGVWTLHGRADRPAAHRARALVLADGAQSALARSLGLVTSAPQSICSRAYLRADSTRFQEDGVMYYPREILPGYCALFREAGGDLNFACYILPGGRSTVQDLKPMHHRLLREDPHVSRAVGPNPQIARMQGAFLRLGGIRQSYADHLLVVGDAAGQIDPLTGEGIQYAMDAGEIAAQTLAEAFGRGDLGAAFLRRYQDRWMRSFGDDFAWSSRIAAFLGRYPVFLDAGAAVMQQRGAEFLLEWGEVMTGARPKRDFLKPGVVLPIFREVIRQWRRA